MSDGTPRDPGGAGKRGERPGRAAPGDAVAAGRAGDREGAALAALPAQTRAGEDVRRRGWFWHWNSLVTQYAPLIGLKGVGLLNSYTVWTDRREESPHRGYAFPSQQSEADFYGEERSELITINKILVALDLIEIRKETVLRPDAQGRRWRVQHNLYRVKDHDDGFTLSGRAVLRVAELADRDRGVYRYVRRVFSPRFAPIDADNVWHRILPEVRQTDLWRRLAERAAQEEERTSARTRAGHAARRGAEEEAADARFFVPAGGAGAAPTPTPSDSAAADTREGGDPAVAGTNSGSEVDVERSNTGSTTGRRTVVGGTNATPPTAVAPTTTTYHQSVSTTTKDDERLSTRPEGTIGDERGAPAGTAGEGRIRQFAAAAAGPGDPPADGPAAGAAMRAFEDANARPSTPAERTILRQLADRFEAPAAATAAARPETPGSGWGWVAAAVYEAVEAGSAFVAPRRLREILLRWERDGYPQGDGGGPGGCGGPRRGMATTSPPTTAGDPAFLQAATASTAARSERGGAAAPAIVPMRALRPPQAGGAEDGGAPAASSAPVFLVEECGLAGGQVWAAVLAEVAARGDVGRADFDAWLRGTELVGRDGDGGAGSALVVGVPHALAERRVAARFLPALRAAVGAVVGAPLDLRVAVTARWLAGEGRESVPFASRDEEGA